MPTDLPKRRTSEILMCRYPGVHCLRGRQRGFSLMEILVAISIIAILLGIGAFGLSKVQAEARRAQTRSMFEGLEGALTEYKTQTTKGAPNHAATGDFNWAAINANLNLSSERFVYAMSTVPQANQMLLAAVSSGSSESNKRIFASKDGDNFDEIYDAWSTPVLYRSNNLTWAVAPEATINGDLSDPKYQTKFPAFFSAGPDKEFGTTDDVTSLELE